jgi:hypothetical protein
LSAAAEELRRRADQIRRERALRDAPGLVQELEIQRVRLDLAEARIDGLFGLMRRAGEEVGLESLREPAPERHLRLIRPGEAS